MMAETSSTIYPPPRPGLPYLVVTFTESGGLEASPATTRVEARKTASRRNIVVDRAKRAKTSTGSKARARQ